MRGQALAAIRQVLGFLRQGFDLDREHRRAFEIELDELLTPHMAVLVRRRTKLLQDGEHRRWCDTLDCYMRESLWPMLGKDREYAERNRTFVTLMIDVAVERAQRRTLNSLTTPLVSQLDASWAN